MLRTVRSARPRPLRALAALAAGLLGVSMAALPAAADEDFVVGSGRADARILRLGPAAGQLALAPTFGLSLADYLGTLGRGEARVADYAALDGSVPEELKTNAPELRVESTEENAPEGKTKTFLGTPAGSPITVGAMEQRASAASDPRGASRVTVGAIAIPGLIEIGAASAESSARVLEGRAREAQGITRIGTLSLGGGVVTMSGLSWRATQRTGEGATVDGTFRIEGVTIAGTALPVPSDPAQLAAAFNQMNAALAPTGLVLDPPVVSKEGDFARVSPLGIRIVNSQLGQTVVAPVIGGLQPVREPITQGLIENCADCASAVLVADVLAGVVSGGGRFDLELGGATGFTEGTRYESPFNFNFSGLGGGASNDFGGSFGGTTTDAVSPSVTGDGAALGGNIPAAVPGSGQADGQATGTLAAARRTGAGTTGGAAVLIGLAGLLGAIALGAADIRAIRSARRTIPM